MQCRMAAAKVGGANGMRDVAEQEPSRSQQSKNSIRPSIVWHSDCETRWERDRVGVAECSHGKNNHHRLPLTGDQLVD